MFDFGVGYSEMFVLALIAVIVIGPKDLPKVLRAFGQMMTKMRGMAREFQGHVDSAMKDAGLEDVKKDLQALKVGNPMTALKNEIVSPPASSKSNDFDTYFGAPDETPKP
ncbi:MAG: Sec-independent protein translocase protein TatB [Aestuariivirga sp.]|jgi:sec-independent protein translocase protein TatB